MSDSKKGFLLIYVAVFILAINPLFAKLIQLPATSIILGRVLIAAVTLRVFSWFQKPVSMPSFSENKGRLLLICLLSAGNYVFFYQSLQASSVGVGISMLMTHPVMTAFLEPFFKKTRFNIKQLGYGILIVVAVAVLSNIDLSVGSAIQGVFWGLLAAFCFAFRNVLIEPMTQVYPSRFLMEIQMWVSVIVLLPFLGPLMHATPIDCWYLLFVATLGTAVAHSFVVKSIQYLPATTSGIISTIQVPVAIILAAIILGEQITWPIIGASLLIVGTAILEKRDHLKVEKAKK